MEQTCPNCGATNRSTSRFCARCGQTLPGEESGASQKSEGSMDLPWLQAVQDKAVQKTSSLDTAAPQEASTSPQPQPQAGPTAEPQAQPPAQQDASSETEPQKDEPPPPWVVSILEPAVTPPGPEQSYEPEELSHIMPWAHGKP